MNESERLQRAASFGAGADTYERSRPPYPDEAVDWLLAGLAASDRSRRVLDLGAGTGKLTRQLVSRGFDVVAIDPSAGMLAELRRILPDVEAVEGSAEAIPAPDASFTAVVVAQAWHWFDGPRATAEVARVLHPGGTFALVWNTRDTAVDWVARLARIIDHGRPSAASGETPRLPVPFAPIEEREVRWRFRLDETAFLDLAASRSAFFVAPDSDRRTTLDTVRALFDEVASASHGDPARRTVELPYVTRCVRSRRGG